MPQLVIHNTLSNRLETFRPQTPGTVRLYVCGPTVYGPVHVGNARPAVVFDILVRFLRRQGMAVTYVRNITDIDDKIIAAAAESGEETTALAERWREQYGEEMRQLRVLPPDIEPRATEYIGPMIGMIESLIGRGFAYQAESHVLFHVPAFPGYGKLSNRRREEMVDGARVEIAPFKKDAADFVLWKPSPDGMVGWESPWGRGRPGWHIECSAMAAACLGEEIDIHGGGQDLIFPHHENERAQSCCAHGREVFAHYWMHNGHVTLDGEKMSKSLDNVFQVGSALRQYPGECLRLALMSAHYRRPLNWTASLLAEMKTVLDKWYRAIEGECAEMPVPVAVEEALADDLNTHAAITELHQLAAAVTQAVGNSAERRGELLAGAQALGLLLEAPEKWFRGEGHEETEAIERQIEARLAARKNRDFARADAIRDALAEQGVLLEDLPDGTTKWRLR